MRTDGKSDIIDTTEKKRLCWHHHVQQMTHERLPKIKMNGVPTGKRRKERADTALETRHLQGGQQMIRQQWHLDTRRQCHCEPYNAYDV
jgi:hypothetical protein